MSLLISTPRCLLYPHTSRQRLAGNQPQTPLRLNIHTLTADHAMKDISVLLCVVPALAVNGPSLVPQLNTEDELENQQSPEQSAGLLENILWMAAPKKRRTIEVNRTRRRAVEKLLEVKVQSLTYVTAAFLWGFFVSARACVHAHCVI